MHPNEALIQQFYSAFQRRDAAAMNACYHPDVEFSDAVFQGLKGDEARAMWSMLCARGKDLRVEFNQVKADDRTGSAHWEAYYTFSGSGRAVHNVIDASFEFKDGLIFRHKDTFDLWKWSSMALGPMGSLLGWSGFLQNKVRGTARKGLTDFMAAQAKKN